MVLGIFIITVRLRNRHVFYVTIGGNFKCFQYFNFKIDFLENENFLQKTGVPLFSWKNWDWIYVWFCILKILKILHIEDMHHFYTKLPSQKSMLRQIEWWEQNRPITKNEVLAFFFWKIYFSLSTSKYLIWWGKPHIRNFCKR